MDDEKTHKPMFASSISNSLSNKRKTRHQSKEKPSKPPSLPLNVTEGVQTHHADYNSFEYKTCTI